MLTKSSRLHLFHQQHLFLKNIPGITIAHESIENRIEKERNNEYNRTLEATAITRSTLGMWTKKKANFEVRNELYISKNDKINRSPDKFYEKSRRKSSRIIL